MARETLPRPTHWLLPLDPETGEPCLGRAENYAPEEVGGELPEHFEDAYFDWRPKHDPNGGWVEREAERREAVWAEAKAAREAEQRANVTVSIGGRALAFQADAASLDELRLQREVARDDPDGFEPIEWTTAGNASVLLDADGLAKVIRAIAARHREAHAASKDQRKRIFDETEPVVRSLADVKAKRERGL